MHPIKVFYNGKRLKDIYPHATRFQVLKFRVRRFFRKLAIVTTSIAILSLAFWAGKTFFPNTAYAVQVQQILTDAPLKAPVLDRIAQCESHGSQTDKNGQVLINSTHDIGKYQINVQVWGKKATAMGLNLALEADNKTFAEYLYENYGTEPWASSKPCWNK